MSDYGDFIRRLRVSRRLGQATLAQIAGISQPNLSAYERGRRVPSLDVLNRIVVACGYQLGATDGRRTIFCPLPAGGWFPDEDLPGPLPGDPPDEAPSVTADTPMAERLRVIEAVLALSESAL